MSLLAYHREPSNLGWETPWPLFLWIEEHVAREPFTLDVCASPKSAKCSKFYDPSVDALKLSIWDRGCCWMNPPYGREIRRWVSKASDMARREDTKVFGLIPARPDAGWWHDHVAEHHCHFVRGRISFVGAKHNCPFPVAIVAFHEGQQSTYLDIPLHIRQGRPTK